MNKEHETEETVEQYDNMKILREPSQEFKQFCKQHHIKIYKGAADALEMFMEHYMQNNEGSQDE